MSIRTSMTWLGDTNGVLPEYRSAFENAVGHGFSKAVILWDGPNPSIRICTCLMSEGIDWGSSNGPSSDDLHNSWCDGLTEHRWVRSEDTDG